MRSLLVVLVALLLPNRASVVAFAQDDAGVPIAKPETSEPVGDPPPEIAYETVTLPKDREAAWQMLREASGLHGDTLRPWFLSAHYKSYDAYGHSKGDGTLEYVWAGRNSWHITYTEGATVWTRWKTEKGIFGAAGQAETPGYPESLLTTQIREPLRLMGARATAPPFFGDEKFSSLTLSCFRNLPIAQATNPTAKGPLSRFCTVQSRPILRFAEGSYSGFYNKSVVFEHRLVAKQINLRDGNDPVLDIEIDTLESPAAAQLRLLEPPAEAVLIQDTTLFLPPEVTGGRAVKKKVPTYPSDMKSQRVQGTVRLAVVIGADGRVAIEGVLHSPAPELTRSAEEAVKDWVYQPYLKDGNPTEIHTTINVTYTIGR